MQLASAYVESLRVDTYADGSTVDGNAVRAPA
jgi:hypothetical protein